jgi:hypothetical protein
VIQIRPLAWISGYARINWMETDADTTIQTLKEL